MTANHLTTDTTETGRKSSARAVSIPGIGWKMWVGLWMSLAIICTFLVVGPAKGFMFPDGARSIMFHVPCAWLATLCYVVGAWYAYRHLRAPKHPDVGLLDDYKCAASMELGLLFSLLTTITGSIFSQMQWGAYWSWDPRQTSILVICLLFAAYVVLRGAVEEPEKRANLASVYALVAIVPGLFLIWVLPRIVGTLHGEANKTVIGNNLGGNYRLVMYTLALPAFIGIFVWLFQLRVRLFQIEARRSA